MHSWLNVKCSLLSIIYPSLPVAQWKPGVGYWITLSVDYTLSLNGAVSRVVFIKKGSGKRLWECRNASMSDVEHYSCIPCSKMQHVENRGTVFPALPPHFTVGCVNSKLPNLVIDNALFYCATLHINS